MMSHNTTISAPLLNGTSKKEKEILEGLNELVNRAIKLMNECTLPIAVPLFADDFLPTNQRNLTDVRTRIGVLLEYEFAKAVNASLPPEIRDEGLVLTYVVANQFPDLAFRSADGTLGIRLEIKAVQNIAEEKSANFSTLIKDIRKGTDFVVVMRWDWKQHGSRNLKFPFVDAFYVMDAYQLALMRDCHWLNNPSKGLKLKSARQGFDLTFAVNGRADSFNEEEGNLGKLTRIFDPSDLVDHNLLPAEVRSSSTLKTYTQLKLETIYLGLSHIGRELADSAAREEGQVNIASNELPVTFVVERSGKRLLIMGGRKMPKKKPTTVAMTHHGAHRVLLLSEKFTWTVRDRDWEKITGGKKPATAKSWVQEDW